MRKKVREQRYEERSVRTIVCGKKYENNCDVCLCGEERMTTKFEDEVFTKDLGPCVVGRMNP